MLGRDLLASGQAGRLTNQDDFNAYLPGLVLTSAPTDDAALVRLSATAPESAMILYYHDPNNPTVVLNTTFTLAGGGRHFYQIRATRNATRNLPKSSLQAVGAALTGEQTFVDGVLGLQTRLEFPYLADVRQFGQNITVTSATALTTIVPPGTITPYLPAPPGLTVSFTDANNHPQGIYVNSGLTGGGPGVPYLSGISPLTNIEQGSYTWSMVTYCQAVINRTRPNNGLLLSSATPDLPNRVVLGSQRNRLSKLKLSLYFITAD